MTMALVKIATFNVNSVKSRLPVLKQWFDASEGPDILCLQETKCKDSDFPKEFFEEYGYFCTFSGMKAYNGVAVLSRIKPDATEFGLGDGKAEDGREESEKARVIRVRFGDLNIINAYVPQGKEVESPEFHYKLRFFERLLSLLERDYKNTDKLLLLGDLNVAPTDIDVTHPETKENHVCFHRDVKEAFFKLISWGLVDIFRIHRPGEGEFSFWDYRVKDALKRNIGWRIDHILGTKPMAEACLGVEVERELRAMEKPSDHTVVVASFEL